VAALVEARFPCSQARTVRGALSLTGHEALRRIAGPAPP
jgi:hypothetical protein